MPYIADHLWQDVLAAGRKLATVATGRNTLDDREDAADKLEAALEAAEGGSDTGGGSCATG